MKNRIIKFRAWDKENKKMYNCCELYITPNGEIIKVGIWRHEEEKKGAFGDLNVGDNKFIVIQFTGLKDKNEKEIFEGDIIVLMNEQNGVVYWEGGRWNVTGKHISELTELFRFAKRCEVIGNKFENPELLK